MAVEAYTPLSDADGYLKRPIDEHGKLRYLYTKTVIATVGDANSTYNFGRLPPGAVRVLPSTSKLSCSAYGASRTLDVGHAAYKAKQDVATVGDGTEAADPDAFTPAGPLDISSALASATLDTLLKFDIFSLGGVDVTGIVAGGTSPLAATMELLIAYLYE